MLDEVAQHGVREAILVGPLRIPKDAVKHIWVGGLNRTHRGLNRHAYVVAGLPCAEPMGIAWDLKAVILRVGCKIQVATGFLQCRVGLLVKYITEPFVEQQREDELLIVASIDSAPQQD